MAIDKKYDNSLDTFLRDTRPTTVRLADFMSNPAPSSTTFVVLGGSFFLTEYAIYWGDVIFLFGLLYLWFLMTREKALAFKLPMNAKFKDPNNNGPGRNMKPEGILYLGNADKNGEEIWFTNSDIRTHILYLGTTGSGKTEGLKSMVSNALCWGSGFVYVDGKADTDLWSSLSSLVRRFGRDDDLLVLNYMTGNSDVKAPSNTMNPFSSGSASYLTQMLVSLMPEASGDNVMWKERAVALVASIMPALTWKRDFQEVPMAIGSIRKYLILNNIIALSRDTSLPELIREGVSSYLDTLPGYVDEAFDDDGKVKPPGPGTPQVNTEVPFQQHGYLSMQLTRALQSLGDEYGYIFEAQAADVDMMDVVLNRRILVVLIPALEKSSDEIANLGKIVSASLKGMMGMTLGTTVEGESATVIENKATHSSTPFMTVFDEVGYYTAEGMAVMAAQARSLGFSLIFAAQDLPALEKRVKEEARSITANCNVKIFGKLEDPTQTKEFFESTVGEALVTELQGFQTAGGLTNTYFDTQSASVVGRARASYDGLKSFKEGQAVCTFGDDVVDIRVFYSNPGFAKAMRVTRYIGLPPMDDAIVKHAPKIRKMRDRLVKKGWTAEKAEITAEIPGELMAMRQGIRFAKKKKMNSLEQSIASIISVYRLSEDAQAKANEDDDNVSGDGDTNQGQESSGGSAEVKVKQPEIITTAPSGQENREPLSDAPKKPAIFSKAPSDGEVIAKSQDATKDVQEEPKEGGSSGGGGPMSFFSPAKTSSQPDHSPEQISESSQPASMSSVAVEEGTSAEKRISQESAQQQIDDPPVHAESQATPPSQATQNQEKKPLNWTDLIRENTAFDSQAADIIGKAAKGARGSIFRAKRDEDVTEAAE